MKLRPQHADVVCGLLATLLFSACGSDPPPPDYPAPELGHHVLVIGIDGLRGDAVPSLATPQLDRLLDGGAWTFEARTQLHAPTVSGPGWTSILMGVDSNKHGIYGNGGWDARDTTWPSFLQRAKDAGLSTAAAIHWLPIHVDILEDDVLDHSAPSLDDDIVAEGMAEILLTQDADVHFVHLDDVDGAGHSSAFDPANPTYAAAVERADGQVGVLLDALEARPTRAEEAWLVVVTSDHGGAGDSHGALDADNRTIPLLIWGNGVVPGELDGSATFLSHMDVHPTVMSYLGIPPTESWQLDGATRGLE